ncbi:MAG: carboxypeptidase regulatory-like domain-containing protein, partial [Candidatus Eisenbacteria bacterium]|nr:carboxypeptidase regulatory-like domain-containing protein [Candidatus Eisenbacteria bacterium]
TGTSGADGLVTFDIGELGTFTAHVRDGLTSETLSGVQYICVANACRDEASYVVVGNDGYQVGFFTRDRDDVINGTGTPPGDWDELYPWIGGAAPIPGIHGVTSIPEEAWSEIRCAVTQMATDTVAEMGDGLIADELAARNSGLVLATSRPQASGSILVYVCYIDLQDPNPVLNEIRTDVYLARGYCETQEVRLVEIDGPCTAREPLGIALIEPVTDAPGCVTTGDLATVHGVVRDASTGEGVAAVAVMVNGMQISSDVSGTYSAAGVIPGDRVLVTAAAGGYQPFSMVLSVDPGQDREQDIVLVPSAQYANQYRFVLTWGQDPQDLDSHVWVPTGAGVYEHVAFWNQGSLTAAPFAELDVDDVLSYGPETITLLPNYEGVYVYSIHEWYGVGTLATSDAVVQLYAGNDLRYIIDVPTGSCGDGWWWHVGELNAETGEFTLINELHETAPLTYEPPRDAGK